MNLDLTSWVHQQLNGLPTKDREFFLKTLGARLFSEANDIKRTREALASELGWDDQAVEKVFTGTSSPEQAIQLLCLLVQNYPVSLKDLWLDLILNKGIALVTPEQSKVTSRIFSRPNAQGEKTPYYEYRDTAMAPHAPFRPEWILELRNVTNLDPENPDVIYNKGHLMNQFTFFIGEVNFYWEDQGKKYSCEMNTGDSCHITPFAPHTFASRNPEKPGLIIAVTYGDNLRRANNHLALDGQVQPAYLKKILSQTSTERALHSPFNLALRLHMDADLKSPEQLAELSGIEPARLEALLTNAAPSSNEVKKLATALQLRPEDLYQSIDAKAVEFANFNKTAWVIDKASGDRHKDLARSQSQPSMKSFVLEVGPSTEKLPYQHAYHQYVYNYSEHKVLIELSDNEVLAIEPDASCYLQPYVLHSFILPQDASSAQILIVRLSAHLNQPTVNELSQISLAGRQRLLSESSQWF